MRRWETLNERQLTLLKKVAEGEDPGAQDPGMRRSAYALRDRGLVTVSRRRGEWQAQVTEAGTFYLERGHHPDHPTRGSAVADGSTAQATVATGKGCGSKTAATTTGESKRTTTRTKPRTPYSERPIPVARRAQATKLVERLVAEGSVVISEPDETENTEWRRVIDFAKRNSLVPPGKRIEKQRQWAGRDLQISLVDGPHGNSGRGSLEDNPRVPVPVQLRSPHRVVATLRDRDRQMLMPASLRRRALLLFQGLAEEAERRGYKVREHGDSGRDRRPPHIYNGGYFPASCREGVIEIVIDGFTSSVTIKQECPQSADPDRSQRLALDIGYSRSRRQHQWGDRKRWKLEDILGVVLRELETRAVEQRQRKLDEEREKEQRRVRWEAAMETAKEQAAQAHYGHVLRSGVTAATR